MAGYPERDITIVRGDTYEHTITFDDAVDRSTWTWRAHLRHTRSDTLAATFSVYFTAPSVVISLTPADTAPLVVGDHYSWDLERTIPGTPAHVRTVLGGKAFVQRDWSHS